MKRLLLAACLALPGASAFGQTCMPRASDPTYVSGLTNNLSCDLTGHLRTTVGAGGGGGASTIADGADVNSGSTTDSTVAAGAAGTLSAKLRRLTTDIGALLTRWPAALGGTTSANSLPVVLSSDGPFSTQTGSITETAPASDTASSGLNGRLQRIAQRITSLIALIPASLGSKADAASLAVTQSTEDKALVAAANTSLANIDISAAAPIDANGNSKVVIYRTDDTAVSWSSPATNTVTASSVTGTSASCLSADADVQVIVAHALDANTQPVDIRLGTTAATAASATDRLLPGARASYYWSGAVTCISVSGTQAVTFSALK